MWGFLVPFFPAPHRELEMNYCGLKGALPSEWGASLSALGRLSLRGNSLVGSIPAPWSTLTLWYDELSAGTAGSSICIADIDVTRWKRVRLVCAGLSICRTRQ